MLTAAEMVDRYKGGALLRRWSLIGGQPRCILAPLVVAEALPEEVAAVEAANDLVRHALIAVEAYEAAVATLAGEEPAATLPPLEGGEPPPSAARSAWEAAQVIVASATAETLALAAIRRGEGAERSEPRILAELDEVGAIAALIVTDDPAASGVPVPPEARIGGTVVRGIYAPPPPPPAPLPVLTPRQLRLALLSMGITAQTVAGALDAIPDPQAREAARIEWEYSTSYERGHALIGAVGTALGLTAGQIDTAWRVAASL